jgi:hypothetical protein
MLFDFMTRLSKNIDTTSPEIGRLVSMPWEERQNTSITV